MKTLFWWIFTIIMAMVIFCVGIILIPMQTKVAEKVELTYIFVDENGFEYDIFEPVHGAATDWSFLFEEETNTINTWIKQDVTTPSTWNQTDIILNPNQVNTWSIPNKDYLTEIIESENNLQTWWNTGIIIPNPDSIKDAIDKLTYVKENTDANNFDSCTTPWNTTLEHGESVIAYEQRKDVPNICNAQRRTCNDGVLNWFYEQWACREDVEYKYTRVKVMSYNNKEPGELIQNPGYAKNDGAEFDTDGKINPDAEIPQSSWNNNVNNPQYNEYTTTLGQKWYYNCTTPWGEIVPHGQFVKAYQSQLWFIDQQCQVELRLCLNWKLNGQYGYKKCNYKDITYQDYKWWNNDITKPTPELMVETLVDDKEWGFFNRLWNLFR